MTITLPNKEQYEALKAIRENSDVKIPQQLETDLWIAQLIEYCGGQPVTTWEGYKAFMAYEAQDTMPEQYQRLHRAISDATGDLVLVSSADILFLLRQFEDHSRPALERKLAETQQKLDALIDQRHDAAFKPKRRTRKLAV